MISLRKPVDKAIVEIYKGDVNAPQGLRWDATGAEILKIKQVYGIGGLYEMTLKIMSFYHAHINYGIDEVVINTNGELISYKHLKTYPSLKLECQERLLVLSSDFSMPFVQLSGVREGELKRINPFFRRMPLI